jgi:hypothetical protein
MPWPPRSPDITPLDFFLWGYAKSSVFRTPVNGLDDLKTRIRNAISAIPADMLHRTWQEFKYRLDVLRVTKGGLLRPVQNFQSFTMICRKPHMASSICLSATIFQNPKGTLWTHCTTKQIGNLSDMTSNSTGKCLTSSP